ncbi:hypothetical protein HQ403_03235 [Candidatus Kaiserbacteria bacterium]|nr:hypothetical protein [Candidatus Kaiserbacteria bacterium]
MDELQQPDTQQINDVPQDIAGPNTSVIISAIGVTILIIATLVGWYFYSIKSDSLPVSESGEAQTSLGSELFDTIDNPVEDQIPSVPTSVNPLDEIYKNPFE